MRDKRVHMEQEPVAPLATEEELTLNEVLLYAEEYLATHPERVDEAQLIGRELVDLRMAVIWERYGARLIPLFQQTTITPPRSTLPLRLVVPRGKRHRAA